MSPALSFTRVLGPGGAALLIQFGKFATVGLIGFCIDTATVYTVAPFLGPYGAGALSYLVAATATWLLNRLWTYRDRAHGGALHRQWVAFLLANTAGFVLNRGTYFALVAGSRLCRDILVLPIAAGAGAGMFVNFFLSRRLVFR